MPCLHSKPGHGVETSTTGAQSRLGAGIQERLEKTIPQALMRDGLLIEPLHSGKRGTTRCGYFIRGKKR